MSKISLEPSMDGDDSYLDMELCTPNIPVNPDADFDSESSPRESASSSDFLPYLVHYQNQFSKSSIADHVEDSAKDLQEVLAFEDEECEEIYRGLRHRESKLMFYDYINEFGNIVLRQRNKMIQWIVEKSLERGLQYETIFLAVNLLDRFLAKGSFEEKRDYKVLGIACLRLATKIEENQYENQLVLQYTFRVGESVFFKPEIIGMEWLVQRVLNFQCYTPTIYNFLCLYLNAEVNADCKFRKTATNLALLSLLDHETLSYSPSTVAAGLMVLAFTISNPKSYNLKCILNIAKKELHCLRSLGNHLRRCNWKELIDADERSYDW